jgi:hypothetical protein
MVLACMGVLAAGIFLAARQHFASMDLGMKNSKLRSHIEQLEGEKRRLIYAREMASSPNELKRSARKAGLIGRKEATFELARVKPKQNPKPVTTAEPASSVEDRPTVIKTSLVQAAKSAQPAAVKKLPTTVASIR